VRCFVRDDAFVDALWRDAFAQGVKLTEKEEALLAGLLWESADELEAIVAKVGGWHGFGLFLRGFGLGLGVWRNERASSSPAGETE